MKPQNPCYKCIERSEDCHTRCETFIEYNKKQSEYREKIDCAKNKDWGNRIANLQKAQSNDITTVRQHGLFQRTMDGDMEQSIAV